MYISIYIDAPFENAKILLLDIKLIIILLFTTVGVYNCGEILYVVLFLPQLLVCDGKVWHLLSHPSLPWTPDRGEIILSFKMKRDFCSIDNNFFLIRDKLYKLIVKTCCIKENKKSDEIKRDKYIV